MKTSYNWILEEAKKFPGSEVLYKEEWQAYCFFIGGKLFGYLGTNKENESIVTLKGNPAMNQELRENYDFIIPGYYMNKVHWISIKLESKDAQSVLIGPLLKKSYELIFSSLPKKIQAQLSM